MPTIHLLVKGKVQGVFYRATARDVAERIGVTGWVKNTREGDVEAVASGSEDQLQQFIQWCKAGPPQAVVTDVSVDKIKDEAFEKFRIAR